MKFKGLFSATLSSLMFTPGLLAATMSPPVWWVGMKEPALQLLIEEKGINGASISTTYPGVTVSEISPSVNPDALFVNLAISSQALPGEMTLILKRKDGTSVSLPYTLLERADGSASRQGFNNKDAIYLLTPDRFANGDTANDSVTGYKDTLQRNEKGGRHGGDITGIIDHLDYISDMGFTQIWSMPMLENAMDTYSYHGYAITDYYKIDPRYGSNEDYRHLSREAAKQGIGLIMDMVLNHIGDNHPWMQSAPDSHWLHHDGTFSATTHIRESMHDIHGTEFDKVAFNNGWFVPSMPDLNQSNE